MNEISVEIHEWIQWIQNPWKNRVIAPSNLHSISQFFSHIWSCLLFFPTFFNAMPSCGLRSIIKDVTQVGH